MAAGTAIITPRILGASTGLRIVSGNDSGAVDMGLDGVIDRGTGTPDAITELEVQADSKNKGRSNIARIVLLRQADDTRANHAVRFASTGATRMASDPVDTAINTKKATVVLCLRSNNLNTDTAASVPIMTSLLNSGQRAEILLQGRRVSLTLVDTANGQFGGLNSPYANDASGFNFFFFSADSTTGVRVANSAVNEEGTTSLTPTADKVFGHSLSKLMFGQTATITQGFDLKMLWFANDYIDITNPANRALFYNPATKEPLDLGADGTVAGVTPMIYMRGMAGDYGLGKNFGTRGDFSTVPYHNASEFPFADLDS